MELSVTKDCGTRDDQKSWTVVTNNDSIQLCTRVNEMLKNNSLVKRRKNIKAIEV